MSRLDPQLETRISRSLDGELSSEEQASLYRELLRDPGANDVLSTSARYDQLAREALDTVLSGSAAGVSGEALEQARRTRARRMRLATRWGSLAAVIALLVSVIWVAGQWSTGEGDGDGSLASHTGPDRGGETLAGPDEPGAAGDGADAGEAKTVTVAHIQPEPREYVGVVSEDRVYWIELTTGSDQEPMEIGDF